MEKRFPLADDVLLGDHSVSSMRADSAAFLATFGVTLRVVHEEFFDLVSVFDFESCRGDMPLRNSIGDDENCSGGMFLGHVIDESITVESLATFHSRCDAIVFRLVQLIEGNRWPVSVDQTVIGRVDTEAVCRDTDVDKGPLLPRRKMNCF